ncbi:MAG: hypothetical protein GTN59_16305, partial [Candidatus Dadabacteria bacterium]|nr:hypothetical protein [Candidatus Dadabacteria bacterium]
AQITTIFDFRPLVKKLTEEMLKSDYIEEITEENTEDLQSTGDDRIVIGGG